MLTIIWIFTFNLNLVNKKSFYTNYSKFVEFMPFKAENIELYTKDYTCFLNSPNSMLNFKIIILLKFCFHFKIN